MTKQFLVSGAASGFGKYLCEKINAIGLTRSNSVEVIENLSQNYENNINIIHCAFNSSNQIKLQSLHQYFEDNILLTQKLINIPHKKFIFLSTVDVYPKNTQTHSEEENIVLDVDSSIEPSENRKGIYATSKLISESIVKKKCSNYLILRPTSLLGKYTRKNNLIKTIEGTRNPLYLSGQSSYNCVLYSDILDFIVYATDHDIKGIYNAASIGYVQLSEVAAILRNEVKFGNYRHDSGKISNKKICSIFPSFMKTSEEVLHEFIKSVLNIKHT